MSYTEEIKKLNEAVNTMNEVFGEVKIDSERDVIHIKEQLANIQHALSIPHIGEMLIRQGRIEYSIEKILERLKFDSYPAGLDSLKFVKPEIGKTVYTFAVNNEIKKGKLYEVSIGQNTVKCWVTLDGAMQGKSFKPEQLYDTEAVAVAAYNAHLDSMKIGGNDE